jgi:hypothetical protein
MKLLFGWIRVFAWLAVCRIGQGETLVLVLTVGAIALIAGVVVAQRFRVLILPPACVLAVAASLTIGGALKATLVQVAIASAAAGVGVQFGYVLGLVILPILRRLTAPQRLACQSSASRRGRR